MLVYKSDKLCIYFGDAADSISKSLHCISIAAPLVDVEPFKSVAQKIDVPRLSVLNQTHGVQGIQIDNEDVSFTSDGDYLITNQLNVGLGILTADCVPVILYDAKNHAIAAVHAGWRGAVAEIVPKTLEHLRKKWHTNAQDVQMYVGPSAKVCCYQVQEDFVQQVPAVYHEKVMTKKNTDWYFDTAQLIGLQMQGAGISPDLINTDFNLCTMCDHRFFSHRRQSVNAGRQITIAVLK